MILPPKQITHFSPQRPKHTHDGLFVNALVTRLKGKDR
jgi:hypothetical protein